MSLESDIADLIRQSGRTRTEANLAAARIAAEGQRERGQIYGNLFSNVAQIAGNLPLQMIQAKAQEAANQSAVQRQQLQTIETGLKVQEASRLAKGRDVLAEAIKSSFKPDEHGIDRPDMQEVARKVTAAGFPEVAQSWLKMTAENDEAVRKSAENSRAQQRKNLEAIGDVAYTAKTPEDFVSGVGLLASYGLVDEQTAMRIAGAADSESEWRALQERYQQFSPKFQELNKPIKIGQGEVLKNLATGEELARGEPKPPTLPELYAKAAGGDMAAQAAVELAQAPTRAATERAASHDKVMERIAALNAEANMIRARRGPSSGATKPRGVTSGDANRLAELQTGLSDLDTLKDKIGTTGAGSKVGTMLWNPITEFTGLGADSKKRQAFIDTVKQIIGKSLEGGVLRKEDEIKYEKILPRIGDPPEVAASKIEGLKQTLTQKRQDLLSSLEDAGYDISRFAARAAMPSATPKKNPFR